MKFLYSSILLLSIFFFCLPTTVLAVDNTTCSNFTVNANPSLLGTLGTAVSVVGGAVLNNNTGPNPNNTANEIQNIICQPQPRITIPGLSFTKPEDYQKLIENAVDGNTYINIPFLGEYLAAVYQYAIAAISIVAVIIIIFSGIQWMLPTGGDNITSAKKRIVGALIGLGLAVSSYVILYSINPDLTKFKNLRVLYIQGEPIDTEPGAENLFSPGTNFSSYSNPSYTAQNPNPPGYLPPTTVSQDLIDQILNDVGWNEQVNDTDVHHERISFNTAVKIVREQPGLLSLFLSVARWGIKEFPADFPDDPAEENWNGRGIGSGKHLMSIDGGGLGIADYFNESDFNNLYQLYYYPTGVPTEWYAQNYHWMQCRGGQYSSWAGDDYCARTNPNATNETNEEAWRNWEDWALSILRRRDAQRLLISQWIDKYWVERALVNCNNNLECAFVNARIANSNPGLAVEFKDYPALEQIELYAIHEDELDRRGTMKRPLAVYQYVMQNNLQPNTNLASGSNLPENQAPQTQEQLNQSVGYTSPEPIQNTQTTNPVRTLPQTTPQTTSNQQPSSISEGCSNVTIDASPSLLGTLSTAVSVVGGAVLDNNTGPNPNNTANEIQNIICQPQPRITIPGLSFTKPEDYQKLIEYTSDGSTYINIPFLGEYLAALYQYAVAAISIISVIVIIFSGIQWMLPTGGDNVTSAKKRIIGALTGLMLAVGSYIILYTINPDLTKFKNLRVLYIQGNPLHSIQGDATDDPTSENEFNRRFNWDTWQTQPPGTILSTHNARNANDMTYSCTVKDPEYTAENQHVTGGTANYDFTYFGSIDPCTNARPENDGTITTIGLHLGSNGMGRTGGEVTANTMIHRVVSTHYAISLDGVVHQLVDEKRVTWNGIDNNHTIAIDLEYNSNQEYRENELKSCFGEAKTAGKTADQAYDECAVQYTDDQYASLNSLINDIIDRNPTIGDIRTNSNVISHCEVAAKEDPPGLNWERIQLIEEPHSDGGRCPFYDKMHEWLNEVYSET